MNKALLSAGILLAVSSLQAQNNPAAFSTDARIKQVQYQDNNVVPIKGVAFVTTQIQFSDNEAVLDIEGGDTAAWMVTYHPEVSNIVFVKPTLFDSNTNLTVITNQHAYYFHLSSAKKSLSDVAKETYALKFTYPQLHTIKTLKSEASTKSSHANMSLPKAKNTAYHFSGSPQLVPLHVFDDGQFTYFELSTQGGVPAIFAVDDTSGKESTVNTRRVGKYLIVQRIAPQFTLRQGTLATSVFNTLEINRINANRRPK
ncbi:MAG: P-type conjugative transfer protein VirB9 [Legionella sp.]|nr:P-type conjugative transfer protein VirB9 [Legionella sp.]